MPLIGQDKENLDKNLTTVRHYLSESQALLYEEGQKVVRLQMELASKDSEITDEDIDTILQRGEQKVAAASLSLVQQLI